MKKSYHRQVQKVIDGITFKIRNSVTNSQHVCITGLNCPRKDQHSYSPAKQKLARNIQGKTLTVRPKAKSYDRLAADVIYKHKCLQEKYRG